MSYSALRQKQTALIRKARDGSVFIAPYSSTAITTLTTVGTNEVQTVTITGTPTGGTFTLTLSGQTTSAIAFSAAASAVQTALQALSTIGTGNATVTGGPGPGTPYTVTFVGTLASTNVATMTANGSLLTGGTTPTVTVTTTTPGVPIDLTPLPSGYQDLGWTTTDGIDYARSTSTTDINSFGATEVTRSDITKDEITMAVTAQETKLLSMGMYTGADTSALVSTAGTGEVKIAKPDRPGAVYYRALGIFVDDGDYGEIWMARYMPRARVTAVGNQKMTDADAVTYNMTLTGFQDSTLGYSHCWYWGGPGWKPLLTAMGIS